MEAFVHPAEAEKREAYFLPCVGDERARPIYLFSLTGPLAILALRFAKGAAQNFGAAMEMNRRIERFGTPCEATDSISRPGSTPSSVTPSSTTSTTSSISATTSGGQQRPVD